ncbi:MULTISPECIES: ABC transporter ATP-binding protein [Pseudomonas]|uniref:Spermidine/putrescine import ATP-binding protein PotA n=1 Tax=Pseudomonas quercus TaxID=2722792 RepID=A0ABX0YI62_9PSED|nr:MULTISPECIES: ABC transporter ATP-binding protein [Pseudomonas]MBF7143123.1 ABC transporter ATP-binding protein [Pseudomonas sp. LY10J]NJP01849.1 ABC transporter ATP-binding protein [Pseudomonas quercus]
MQAKLKIEGIHKRFGAFQALAPTALELRQGEFLTLLGPSGSGKTTLLMMVAGLLEPDGGKLWIDGTLATYAPPYERDIGMVFQNYALFPHMTIAENVGFPLRMRRRPLAEVNSEVARVLELVQLSHTAHRLPRELSGGQQQRIALARCIVYQPSIILMDEPLGALDKKLRDQLQIEIKRLHRQLGTTILFVTHDQQEALTMSDRICLMNHGRIEQLGTPSDLYFRPKTTFAADFLGESNIVPGVAQPQGAAQCHVACPTLGISLAVDGAHSGPVNVMVRPERVGLFTAPQPGMNSVQGTLSDVVFTGGVTRFMVNTVGGAMLMVEGLTLERELDATPGTPVWACWQPAETVILPADAVPEAA